MSNFFGYIIVTAMLYFGSLVGIEYAFSKSKKTKLYITSLIVIIFSIFNAWAMSINENKIPIDVVEKEWDRYVNYCREEHISWSDLTFPEWLSLESEGIDNYDDIYDDVPYR